MPGFKRARSNETSLKFEPAHFQFPLKAKLDKYYPRVGKPTQLAFEYAKEEEADTGKGL